MNQSNPNSPYLPSPRGIAIARTIAILALIQGIAMVFSNIAANHIWHIRGIPFDGGIFIFIAVSASSDMLVELFHKDTANRITTWCIGVTLCGGLAVQLCEHLPSLPGANNINLAIALGMTSRVCIASAVGFFVDNRVNNAIYEVARRHLGEDKYMPQRFNLSTAAGQIVDNVLFNFIAFGGRLTVGVIFQQIFVGYAACMLLKILTTRFISVPITRAIRHHIDHA